MPERYRIIVSFSTLLLFCAAILVGRASAANGGSSEPNLGGASMFTLLAANSVNSTGATLVQGQIGVGVGKNITGFPPATLTGSMHVSDADALGALNELTVLYLSVAGSPCGDAWEMKEVTGTTIQPGQYCFASSVLFSGVVTLDAGGNSDAYWLFRIPGGLSVADGAQIRLAGGALAAHVYWIADGGVTIGSKAAFAGNILSQTSIQIGSGATLTGRAFSLTGDISLDASGILYPALPAEADARALYDDPARFELLSSQLQNILELKFGRKGGTEQKAIDYGSLSKKATNEAQGTPGGGVPTSAGPGGNPAPLSSLANPPVNNPAADATSQDTQSETTIITGSTGTLLAGFNDSGSYLGGAYKFTGYSRSTDGGASWTDMGTLPTNSTGDAGDPVMARDNSGGTYNGQIYFATLRFLTGNGINVFRSTDNGTTFQAPVDGGPGTTSSDKHWITVDNNAGTGQGYVYVVVRDFGGGNGIFFCRSTDGGATFSTGVSLASGASFNVQGAWIVVRPNHDLSFFYYAQSSPQQILVRKSTDQGTTWGPAVVCATLATTGVNGDLGLGFRSNAFPHAVVNPVSGNLYLAYADNPAGADRCDIMFTQSPDGGSTWSSPVRVNTDAGTNDQFGPAIGVTPDGTKLMIGWYDRRMDPANSLIQWWGRIGTISGSTVTFGSDFGISAQFPAVYGVDPVVNSVYMGDYDVITADNSYFYTTWGDNRDQSIAVPARKNANVRSSNVPVAGPGVITNYVSTVVSGGNGNGMVEFNECNSLTITISNTGTATATSVSATLTTSTPNVSVFQGVSAYPNISPGGSAANTTLFQINTNPSFTCGTPIQLTLTVTYAGGSDVLNFTLPSNPGSGYTMVTSSGASIVPGTVDVGNHCDDCVTSIALPFSFTFYGTPFASAYVSSNGNLQFSSTNAAFSNACIPTASMNNLISPHWDDLYTVDAANGQGIFTSVSGIAPNRIFNIEWRANFCCSSGIPVNDFEIRLYETTNQIEFIYGAVPNLGSSATVGIQQGTGASFLQYSCNSGVLSNGFRILISPATCPDGGGQCGAVCSITCPANITVGNAPNQCGAVVTYPAPSLSGPCGTVTCTPASGSFFPVGTTTVTCATVAGPTCSFTIRVNDTQPPSITCPANISVESNAACNGANVTFPAPTISDNCPGVVLQSVSPSSGSLFPIGTTTVTAIARDAAGNTAACSFTVTVVMRPVISVAANPIVFSFSCKSSTAFTRQIAILNTGGHFGGGVMNWSASTAAPEITLSPVSGVEGGTLGITVDPTGLPYGDITRTITITAFNSATGAAACNSPFTLNIVISVQPDLPTSQTLSVGGSYTAFTNGSGQKVAEVKSNVGTVSFTVNCFPCTYPNGMARLRYVKRYYTFGTSATTRNFDIRTFYTNSELVGITDPTPLTLWQQPIPGGAWTNRGGTADIFNNNVTAPGILNLNGVFAMARSWTPKTMTLKLLAAMFDRQTRRSVLQWVSNLQTGPEGFLVERSTDLATEAWDAVGSVPSNASGEYGFSEKLAEDGKYYYRLVAVDADGTGYESDPVLVVAGSLPLEYALEQNYPNPFNPSTLIRYQIGAPGSVSLKVYDTYWRQVAVLVDREQQAGIYQISFDAANLPSGVYYYKLESGAYSQVRKMNLTK